MRQNRGLSGGFRVCISELVSRDTAEIRWAEALMVSGPCYMSSTHGLIFGLHGVRGQWSCLPKKAAKTSVAECVGDL
jgi:hypothetical protein